MSNTLKNALLTLLALALLFGAALAFTSPDLTREAQDAYMDEGPADVDDEYAFLFE